MPGILHRSRRLAFGLAVIPALMLLPAARVSRAQNQPPPATSQSPAPEASQPPPVSHSQHSITLTFDYDFASTPVCSKKITKLCVQQFVAYDISAGAKNASMLFTIPVPADAKGFMHGITASSPKLDFESGKHLISVIAQSADGSQSKKNVCTTWVEIP